MRLLSGLVGIVCLLSLVQTVLLAATLNWPAGNAGSTADRSMAMQTGRHTASTQPQAVSPICLLCAAAWQGQTAHGLSTPGLPASLLPGNMVSGPVQPGPSGLTSPQAAAQPSPVPSPELLSLADTVRAAGPAAQLTGTATSQAAPASRAALPEPGVPAAPAGQPVPADPIDSIAPIDPIDPAGLAALLARYPLEAQADGPGRTIRFAARAEAQASGLPSLRLVLEHSALADAAVSSPDVTFPAVSAAELEASVRKLSGARRLERAQADSLLATVPGIAAGAEKTSADTALLMFTSPDCRHCQTMQHMLGRLAERVSFPVLFLPLGREQSAKSLYTKPGAQPSPAEELRMQTWLDAATDWLVQAHGSTVTWVPCFVWIMGDDVRMATLNKRDVLVLAAWLNARCPAPDTSPGRTGRHSQPDRQPVQPAQVRQPQVPENQG